MTLVPPLRIYFPATEHDVKPKPKMTVNYTNLADPEEHELPLNIGELVQVKTA